MKTLNLFLREVVHSRRMHSETIVSLRQLALFLALMTAVFGYFFLSSHYLFPPTEEPGLPFLGIHIGQFEVWDFLLPIAAFFSLMSVIFLRWLTLAHIVSAGVWLTLGLSWIEVSLRPVGESPSVSYLFVSGVFAMFICAQNLGMIRAWKSEGIS